MVNVLSGSIPSALIMCWGSLQAQVLAKYISDYNIKAIKFSPYEEGRLMTCGKDSVRMFRLKVSPLYPACIDQQQTPDRSCMIHHKQCCSRSAAPSTACSPVDSAQTTLAASRFCFSAAFNSHQQVLRPADQSHYAPGYTFPAYFLQPSVLTCKSPPLNIYSHLDWSHWMVYRHTVIESYRHTVIQSYSHWTIYSHLDRSHWTGFIEAKTSVLYADGAPERHVRPCDPCSW